MLTVDICVVGGGPAGSIAARQLALHGHSVCLVEQDADGRKQVGESLSQSIVPLLEKTGLMAEIERAGFLRSSGARVRWKSETVEDIPHHAGGFLIDRQRFDRLLLARAEAAGVRVICPASAALDRTLPDGNRVAVEDFRKGETHNIDARFIIDAAGRRGVIGGSRQRLFAQTIALCGHWRGTAFPRGHTLVEAAPWGWAWGALLPGGVFSAIAFVDPKLRISGSDDAVAGLYRRLLGSLQLFSPCATARIDGRVKACDASIHLADDMVGADWIKIGESAFSIDPLSSQGVQAAIRGGIQAAATIHTILIKPERSVIAQRFYRERQSEAARHSALTSARMHAECQRFANEPFWSRRAAADIATDEIRTVRDNRPALESQDWIDLSRDASLARTTVIDGDFIASIPALSHPSLERPVGYLGELEIARLLESLQSPIRVRDLVKSWRRLAPQPMVDQMVQWMWQRRILETRAAAGRAQPTSRSSRQDLDGRNRL